MNLWPLFFAILGMSSLPGNTLITPTSLTTNGISEFFPAENIINDSGLTPVPDISNYETATHGGASATTAWTTNNPNGADDYFLEGAEGQVPEFTFMLPEVSSVNALVYWGYFFTSTNGNETREFVLEFSTDGGETFSAPVTVAAEPGELAGPSAKTLPFEQDFVANVIRIRLTDNHFGDGAIEAGGDRMGLGEIKFIGSPGAGEPLAITEFELDGDQITITSTTGLRSGVNYHLEAGNTLEDFQPVPDTNFTSDSVSIPSISSSDSKLFIRIVEGPGPVL